MKSFFVCFVLIAQLLCLPSTACPPSPTPWDIDDPANGKQTYNADISCSGEALSAASYIVKVVATNSDILQSKGNTSGDCSWATTVPEPEGGWPLYAPNQPRPATLELWQGGNMKDSEVITLN